MTLVGYQTV